jgi:hypothetical protein
MTNQRTRGPLWPLILALAVPPVVLGILLSVITSGNDPEDLWVGATGFGPTSTAPAEDIQAVHNALHDIGEQCLTPTPDMSTIAADVGLITAFAQQYPVGRFPIDDETATASSFLIVTRGAVAECAPENLDAIDAQLRNIEPE